MATVDSSSTLAQVQAAYDDNASYATSGSVTMAQDFVTAGRILLRRIPQESGSREGNVRFEMELIAEQIRSAEEWIASNPAASHSSTAVPTFVRGSVRNFRG